MAGRSPASVVFELEDVTKVYHLGQVQVHALRGVSVDFREGEYVVLLGHSGSGKSTLLNILGGLDAPSAGRIRYRGWDMTQATEHELTEFRRRQVGFVFQFYNLIPSLSAEENVELVGEISEAPMPAGEALRLVGLADRAGHFPTELSGGEQQRVAIARAIAKRPDVLLCDEPTGALDISTGTVVLEAVDRIQRELGTTVVFITHNASIGELGHRVLTLSDGQIVGDRRIEHRLRPEEIAW